MSKETKYGRASLGVHADDHLSATNAVAPFIGVSTTYKYPDDPDQLKPPAIGEDVYSRETHPNNRRVEEVLGKILDGHAICYSSGLAAFHAAMIHLNPKRVFIGQAYFGCHSVLNILKRNYNVEVHDINSDPNILQKGDVVHLETPVNPTGLAFDMEHYARIAHERGAFLLVDATFAPPPLQFPFEHGADMIMHSATKYLGGHSDLLAGVLVTKDPEIKEALWHDREAVGTISPSLESWLLLRSLRTFDMRIRVQQENATKVVNFLVENKDQLSALDNITHSSLQTEEFISKQLPLGGPPVFALELKRAKDAKTLPSKLKLFHHATSLGGAESLVEWRILSDKSTSDRLLRFSVGVENAEDLIEDLRNGFSQL